MGNTLSEILVSALNPSPLLAVKAGMTHSGPFHADDVLSAAVLQRLNPGIVFVRTRDRAALAEGKDDPRVVLFDAGFEYNPGSLVFDHHQKPGPDPRPNGVPFAAAGLIWRELGVASTRSVLDELGIVVDDDTAILIAEGVDLTLMQGVDAMDNGDVTGKSTLRTDLEVELRVKSFAQIINGYGPVPLIGQQGEIAQNAGFYKALPIAGQVLENAVRSSASFVMSRDIVRQAVQDSGGEVVELTNFVFWQEHLFQFEEPGQTKYVIFPQDDSGEPTIMVQQVPLAPGRMEGRLPLPEAWAGKRGSDLDEVTGVEGGVFCHPGRFIAGHSDRPGARKLAELALASGTAPEPQVE